MSEEPPMKISGTEADQQPEPGTTRLCVTTISVCPSCKGNKLIVTPGGCQQCGGSGEIVGMIDFATALALVTNNGFLQCRMIHPGSPGAPEDAS